MKKSPTSPVWRGAKAMNVTALLLPGDMSHVSLKRKRDPWIQAWPEGSGSPGRFSCSLWCHGCPVTIQGLGMRSQGTLFSALLGKSTRMVKLAGRCLAANRATSSLGLPASHSQLFLFVGAWYHFTSLQAELGSQVEAQGHFCQNVKPG